MGTADDQSRTGEAGARPKADPRAGQRWQDPNSWRPRLGLMLSAHQLVDTPPAELFDKLAGLAQAAEEAGFDSLWFPDHFIQMTPSSDAGEASMEAYTTLAALAVVTKKLYLGTSVVSVTHRHPPVLARQLVTIDIISGGRAVLGIGRGWAQDEHKAYGIRFGSARERSEMLEEAVMICRSMFTEERSTYRGRHYEVVDALNVPLPLSRYGPPVMIGGAGRKFTLPLVARLADICNPNGTPEELKETFAYLDGLCQDCGRDPSTLWRTHLKPISIGPTDDAAEALWSTVEKRILAEYTPVTGSHRSAVDQLRQYADVGVEGVLAVLPYHGTTPDEIQRVGAALDEALPAPRQISVG